jgi:serine/threonine-protein kinase RsbW
MVTPASTIDVSGPAQAGTVGLLRAVAASLAARLGMDVEAIEELRMAVDEASSLLLTAGPGERLSMSLDTTADGHLAIRVRTDARIEALPTDERTSWPWRVIRQLTTDAEAIVDDDGAGVSFRVGAAR